MASKCTHTLPEILECKLGNQIIVDSLIITTTHVQNVIHTLDFINGSQQITKCNLLTLTPVLIILDALCTHQPSVRDLLHILHQMVPL